jgi:hypothetical protein
LGSFASSVEVSQFSVSHVLDAPMLLLTYGTTSREIKDHPVLTSFLPLGLLPLYDQVLTQL